MAMDDRALDDTAMDDKALDDTAINGRALDDTAKEDTVAEKTIVLEITFAGCSNSQQSSSTSDGIIYIPKFLLS